MLLCWCPYLDCDYSFLQLFPLILKDLSENKSISKCRIRTFSFDSWIVWFSRGDIAKQVDWYSTLSLERVDNEHRNKMDHGPSLLVINERKLIRERSPNDFFQKFSSKSRKVSSGIQWNEIVAIVSFDINIVDGKERLVTIKHVAYPSVDSGHCKKGRKSRNVLIYFHDMIFVFVWRLAVVPQDVFAPYSASSLKVPFPYVSTFYHADTFTSWFWALFGWKKKQRTFFFETPHVIMAAGPVWNQYSVQRWLNWVTTK